MKQNLTLEILLDTGGVGVQSGPLVSYILDVSGAMLGKLVFNSLEQAAGTSFVKFRSSRDPTGG